MLTMILIPGVILAIVTLVIFLACRFGNSPPPKWLEWVFPCVFGVGWTASTVCLDFAAIRDAMRQHRAAGYVAVEGEVTKSAIAEQPDGDSTVYDVDIEYVYRVGGEEYRGKRISYYKMRDQRWVSEFVEAHPPGKRLVVHHDPADPAEAVLIREMNGELIKLAIMLVPYNLLMMGLVYAFIIYVRHGTIALLAPFTIIEERAGHRIRLAPTSASVAGLFGLFLSSFVLAAFVSLCCGMSPSIATMAAAWAAVPAIAIFVYWRQSRRIATGDFDLVINKSERMMTLPKRSVAASVMVPFSALASIEVVAEVDSEGYKEYVPTVRWRAEDGATRECGLARWSEEKHADQLAVLLRSEAGLTALSKLRPERN